MKHYKKRSLPTIVIILMLTTACYSGHVSAQATVSGTVTYQSFYDNLSPYGTWINYPGYGHVWNPRVNGEFRPYATNGNWVYSDEGWAWSSNYVWGWAPFHYGSWLYDDMYGWLWVPGYDWSPAWVTWGSVDDYYCWAPIMPGINLSVQFGSWRPHSFYWNVCSREHIYDRDLSRVIEGSARVSRIANRISIINNFNSTHNHDFYSRGPNVGEVEKFTNRRIDHVSFRAVDQINHEQHDGNTMKVYRPNIQNPQPHEFRTPENDHIKPIRSGDQWPSSQRTEQQNNIDRLPMHRSDGSFFHNNGGGRPGSGRRGR